MELALVLARFAHVLIPVYWLGGDLGTFLCGRAVRNPALTPAARLAALDLLLATDMGPRSALVLTLPTGLTLAVAKGWLGLDDRLLAVIWGLGLAWLGLVWRVHLHHGSANERWRKLDLALRYVLLASLVMTGCGGLVGIVALPLFLSLKLLLLAEALALGILVRRQLVPLFPAIAALRANGGNPATDRTVETTLQGTTRSVFGIWAVVLLAVLIGLAVPI